MPQTASGRGRAPLLCTVGLQRGERFVSTQRGTCHTTVFTSTILAVLVPLGLAVGLSACADNTRPIVAPPDVAGAEFLGTDACTTCHADIAAEFAGATHSALIPTVTAADGGPLPEDEEIESLGCEGCHGPGSLHVASGGGRREIVNPEDSPAACFQCHQNVRGDFSLPHTHPVTTGPLDLGTAKISCGDCHASHAGHALAGGGTDVETENDLCISCHQAQHGPYVFEHEAVLEGCTTCHRPHGSVNAVLLTERNATLCMKCHFQEQTGPGVVLIGGRDHSLFLSQGTCWSAGCHEAVHGSQVSTSLRY
jgi:predicted CXXCH cytochrome family protein